MTRYAPRSLKHEYELFVEREIENYKESVPRGALLAIGDEAAAVLAGEAQFALTELVLCEEVDRIIARRIRLPAYRTWRRKRLRMQEQYASLTHWGLDPDAALVRAISPTAETRVLVAGSRMEEAALYLAANGCEVTAVEQEEDVVERVLRAAGVAGLSQRVHGCITDLGHWSPEAPLDAVVCTPAAFAGLSIRERAVAIEVLQEATTRGGIHLVETGGVDAQAVTIAELRSRYQGWDISVERAIATSDTFLARKAVA